MEQKRRGQSAAKAIFIAGAIVFVLGLFFSGIGNPSGILPCGAGVVVMAAGLMLMKRPEYLILLVGA